MAAQVLAQADTVLSSTEYDARHETLSAADALREHFRLQGRRPAKEVAQEVARRVGRLGKRSQAQSQHVYQQLVAAGDSLSTGQALSRGYHRMRLLVPAKARLLKWQASRALHDFEDAGLSFFQRRGRTRRLVRSVLPLALLLGGTVACSLVQKDGEGGGTQLAVSPVTPELSKPKVAEGARRKDAPWSYILPIDHGIRADRSGQGHFRAPRFHGEHNGLDLLAPVGTPVFSPCDGKAMAGVSRSFGRWLHVICPVPEKFMKKGGPRPWASFFYAHLHKTDLPHNTWVNVKGAQGIGQVGKSGNARGPNVQPHLHFEMIVQKNRRAAMDERHLGKDQSGVPAAEHFVKVLSEECMAPYGFQPKSQLLRRARRIDPFLALTCLSDRKPNYLKAPSPLTDSSFAWTKFYVAKDFNVNLGVEDSRLAKK